MNTLCSADTLYLQQQLEENQRHYLKLKCKLEIEKAHTEKSRVHHRNSSTRLKVAQLLQSRTDSALSITRIRENSLFDCKKVDPKLTDDCTHHNKSTSKSDHNSLLLKNLSSSFFHDRPPTHSAKRQSVSKQTVRNNESIDQEQCLDGMLTPLPTKNRPARQQGPVLFSFECFDVPKTSTHIESDDYTQRVQEERMKIKDTNIQQIESSLSKISQFFSTNNNDCGNEAPMKIQSIYNSCNKPQRQSQRHFSIYVTPQIKRDKENIKPTNRVVVRDSSFQAPIKQIMKPQHNQAIQKQTGNTANPKGNHTYGAIFNEKKRRHLSLFD